MFRYPDILLIVMARAPVTGQVKTRLAGTVGHRRATGIYRNMLQARVSSLIAAGLCPVELHVAPHGRHPAFLAMRRKGVRRIQKQIGADLGSRMHYALRSGLARANAVILTGADVPGIKIDEIEQVCQALSDRDECVLVPAVDGGYGLLATGRAEAGLFRGIRWGSERVCQQTVVRARRLGMDCLLLGNCRDIDDRHDLPALRESGVRYW